ncbi:MAG: hypothetical protein NTY22_01100 [Proteobacteria bacterium]|nr:hypothetical protein [Pseudomonadota bacterium]
MKYLLLVVFISFPLFADENYIIVENGCGKVKYMKVETKEVPYRYVTTLGSRSSEDYNNKERSAVFGCGALGLSAMAKNKQDKKQRKDKPVPPVTHMNIFTIDNKSDRNLYCELVNRETDNKIIPIEEWKKEPKPKRFDASGREYVDKGIDEQRQQNSCLHTKGV